MLTPDGLAWVARLLESNFAGANIVVSDGTNKAVNPVTEVAIEEGGVVLRTTFGEDEANFEWATRSIILPDGTEVDRIEEDQGRKAVGQVWGLEARIDLGGG